MSQTLRLINYNVPLTVGDTDYDLRHLHPEWIVLDPETDTAIKVKISFNSHVYSEEGSHNDHDFQDELGRPRRFSQERYQHSLSLPKHIQSLISKNALTWQDGPTNKKAHMLTLDGMVTEGEHYVVVYELYRASHSNHVEMIVKSAYSKPIDPKHSPKRDKLKRCIKECYFKATRFPR